MPVIKEVAKLWGTELWHHNDSQYCMKTLVMRPGAQSSLHYHRVKRETFLVTRGTRRDPDRRHGSWHRLKAGDSVTIEPGVAHRFRAATDDGDGRGGQHHARDDDVVRLEPSHACYKRRPAQAQVRRVSRRRGASGRGDTQLN